MSTPSTPSAAPATRNNLLRLHSAIRGEIERGGASRITDLPERTARRVLNDAVAAGLLASDTPKPSVAALPARHA